MSMTTQAVTIEITRPMYWDGTIVPTGATLKLTPSDAAQAVGSGRARLVHQADTAQLKEAVHAEVRQALKAERRGQISPPAGWPWRSVA